MNKPRRHWFQFSIKSLFVIMVFAAGYFSGLATMMRHAQQERERAQAQAERAAVAERNALEQAEAMFEVMRARNAQLQMHIAKQANEEAKDALKRATAPRSKARGR